MRIIGTASSAAAQFVPQEGAGALTPAFERQIAEIRQTILDLRKEMQRLEERLQALELKPSLTPESALASLKESLLEKTREAMQEQPPAPLAAPPAEPASENSRKAVSAVKKGLSSRFWRYLQEPEPGS